MTNAALRRKPDAGNSHVAPARVIVCALACGAALLAQAETYTWTGEFNSEWTNGLNWVKSNGKHPTTGYNPGYGSNEEVVFDPGEGKTICVFNNLSTWPNTTRLRSMSVLSGTVIITNGYLHFDEVSGSVTSIVHVAKGATLDIYAAVAARTTGAPLVKTGEGDWVQRRFFGRSGKSGLSFGLFDVQGGSFYRAYGYNTGWDADSRQTTFSNLIVRTGASFGWQSYSMISGNPEMHLEKGSTLHLGREGSSTIDGLSGEGSVVLDGGSHGLTMVLGKRDYVFGGDFRGTGLSVLPSSQSGSRLFTIAASNAFANVGSSGLAVRGSQTRFASGIGDFHIRYLASSVTASKETEKTLQVSPLVLEDTDGQPITLHVGCYNETAAADAVFSGKGNLMMAYSQPYAAGLTNGQSRVTGEVGCDRGSRLVLGRMTEGTDPDLSAASAIRGDGEVVFYTFAPFLFTNRVTSAQSLTVYGATTLADLKKTGGAIAAYADFTVGSGSGTVSSYLADGDDTRLTLADCALDGGKNSAWMNQWDTFYHYPRRIGSHYEARGAAEFALTNSDVMIGRSDGDLRLGNMTLADSKLTIARTSCGCSGTTSPDAVTWKLDNATLRFDYAVAPYSFYLPSDFGKTPAGGTPDWAMEIGPRGARIESSHQAAYGEYANHLLCIRIPLRPFAGAANGNFVFAAPNTVSLQASVALTGPVSVEGCRVLSTEGNYTAGNDVLGTGDFSIDGGYLDFDAYEESLAPQVAAGAGRTFTYRNASRVQLHDDGQTANGLTLTTRRLVRGDRGVLILTDSRGNSGFEDLTKSGRFLVTDGVPCDTAGRVKEPVFAITGDVQGGGWGSAVFLTYSEEDGLVPFANYTTGLGESADAVACVDAASKKCSVPSGTKTVSALRVSSFSGADDQHLEIAAGATLRVGNGTDPACVLMDAGDSSSGATIAGAGTLDFGSSEGVVAVARPALSTAYPAQINASIAGTGGLTVAGAFGFKYSALTLGGANTYSGGTRISCVAVRPTNDSSFGSGLVEVVGSGAQGGQICFTKPVTIANPLAISGNGINSFSTYHTDINGGAIWFLAEATVAGPVEIVGQARVGSKINRLDGGSGSAICDGTPSVGTFTGVISGGRLQLLQSVKPVVLTAANTYTGGTEIVSSPLTLRGPCSVGTGAVVLDRGTLRFENTSAVTFTNAFETGSGTVQLAGAAPVTFTGVEGIRSDLALDLDGTAQTFTALPPFASVTNSAARFATMTLAGGLGTVAWAGRTLAPANKIKLALGAGTVLDLGGETLTVRHFTGDRETQIVNGTLVETNPVCGTVIILR